MTTTIISRRITGPPGFSMDPYRTKLKHSAMRVHNTGSINQRKAWCRTSPILWALYYFRDHLKLDETRPDGSPGVVNALSEFHVELAMHAKEWMRKDIGPKEVRHAWVAPRKGAKSTWLFLILPLWAMAYGHRKFIVVYSDVEGMAGEHLATLRLELSQNDRLIRDFPELCSPLKVGGRAVKNNSSGYLAANGSMIQVKGMNSATLGVKHREHRPDALLFDDIEPKKGDYSIDRKNKRLEDLLDAIMPCNDEAVVEIAGTTVMHSSIIHDIIERKAWVAKENIQVHHFPGIVEDPETGEERSCWPERWSLEYLRSERANNKRSYAKNFDNAPVSENGTFWDDDDITYDAKILRWVTERILVVDPAAKSKKTNDETGIAMVSYAGNVRKVVVERVMGVRMKPPDLRHLVHRIVQKNGIKLIVVDVTNGGDHVLNTLSPLPPGVKFFPTNLKRSKPDRFSDLHDLYLRKPPGVVHARPITTLESQMASYPKTMHDDQIDVVCLGKEYFHGELVRAS